MAQSSKRAVSGLYDRRADRYLRQAESDSQAEGQLAAEARHVGVEWLATLCPWDLYATLTYDPKRVAYDAVHRTSDPRPPSDAACTRHLLAYVRTLSMAITRPVSAAAALESTRAGWPHFHALLDMGGVSRNEFVLSSRLWFEKRGFVLLDRVVASDHAAVSAYLLKYFTKVDATFTLAGPLGHEPVYTQTILSRKRR